MAKLRVHNIAVSLVGYMAGPDQSHDAPLGFGGEQLHSWAFATRSFRTIHGMDDSDLDGAALGYTCVETVTTPSVMHARFTRSA